MAEENRFAKNSAAPKEDANKWLVVVGLIVVGLLIGGGLVFATYKLTQPKVPAPLEVAPTPTRPVVREATPPAPTEEILTGNCHDECTARGFASGYCDTAAVYPGEELCEVDEENIGWTADCFVPERLVGASKGCCCLPLTEPLADWETYTNSKYGYQFQHPADWSFTVDVVNEDPGEELYVIRQGINSMDIDGYNILVRAWDNPDELSLPEWIQFMKDSNALATPTEEMDLTPNTQVGGEDALQFWSDPISGGAEPGECVQACPSLSVYFVHGDKAYLAMLMYTREFDEDSFLLFSQILSTFEFL